MLRTFLFYYDHDRTEPLAELGLADAEVAEREAEKLAAQSGDRIVVMEELFTVDPPESR